MKKAILAVSLSVSAAHAAPLNSADQQILNDLITQSGVIAGQIRMGQNFVTNVVAASGDPALVYRSAVLQALITDAQQNAYNQSMTNFINNEFYTAQDHMDAIVAEAQTDLSEAVDTYTEAASVIQVVTTINQRAQQVDNVAEAEVLQDYAVAQGADQGVTDQQQDAYNDALVEVSTSARAFATYKAASLDASIIARMDDFEASYGGDLNYSQTTILDNGYLRTTYFDATGRLYGSLTHSDYFVPVYQGPSLYEDNGYGLGD